MEKVKNEMPEGWCHIETFLAIDAYNLGGKLCYLLGCYVTKNSSSSLG